MGIFPSFFLFLVMYYIAFQDHLKLFFSGVFTRQEAVVNSLTALDVGFAKRMGAPLIL